MFAPELPLRTGAIPLISGLSMPSCIRDASPDAWGRRVLINRKLGISGADAAQIELDELTYLLESGSDRIGALDARVVLPDCLQYFVRQHGRSRPQPCRLLGRTSIGFNTRLRYLPAIALGPASFPSDAYLRRRPQQPNGHMHCCRFVFSDGTRRSSCHR